MPDNSFDVVSKIEMPEVLNAVQQALKEVTQRYDLKDSHSKIELNEKDNKIAAGQQGRIQTEGCDRYSGVQAGQAQSAAQGAAPTAR